MYINTLQLNVTSDSLIETIKSGNVTLLKNINNSLLEEHGMNIHCLLICPTFEVLEFAVNDDDNIDMFRYLHETLYYHISIRTIHKILYLMQVGKGVPQITKYVLFDSCNTIQAGGREGILHSLFNSFKSNGIYSWNEQSLELLLQDNDINQWFKNQKLDSYPLLLQYIS
jgi:hypothetical protein